LTGSILGVQYDALLAGFFGGLVSLSYLPHMPPIKIARSLTGSAIIAGFLAPILAAFAVNYFSWLAGVGEFTRIAAAGLLGIRWQAVLPAGLDRVRSLVNPKGSAQ
jgi:hypothetical protein